MKTFSYGYFYTYGWRPIKNWRCPYCNNFHTFGMDSSVDESVKRHLMECTVIAPRFTGFDDIEILNEQIPNFHDPKYVLSKRLTRMQQWIEMKAPWVFLEKEMELIMKGFNKL